MGLLTDVDRMIAMFQYHKRDVGLCGGYGSGESGSDRDLDADGRDNGDIRKLVLPFFHQLTFLFGAVLSLATSSDASYTMQMLISRGFEELNYTDGLDQIVIWLFKNIRKFAGN